ncbi:MAG: hypothetical protein KDC35_16200 [Acidobacteria bacterium]|nr:hypothetical protein [Acidobacteriota bacterium]
MLNRLVLFNLLMTCGLHALEPGRLMSQYMHRQWGTDDGLPQSSVTTIAQTEDGFLWFGTQEGLVRFDGIALTVYDTTNSPSMGNHFVNDLLVDQDGQTLWIATRGGVLSLGPGGFTPVGNLEGLSDPRAYALAKTDDGSLWVATNLGLGRIDHGSLTMFGVEDGIPDPAVRALQAEGSGLWVGTRGGLVFWDQKNGATSKPQMLDPIWCLLRDRSGTLWIGSRNAVFALKAGVLQKHEMSMNKPGVNLVLSLAEDRDNHIWVGTSLGLARLNSDAIEKPRPGAALDELVIRSLFEDMDGNLWLGSGWNGLHQLSNSELLVFSTDEGLPNKNAWAVAETRQGVFVGTDQGVSRVEKGQIRTTDVPAAFIRAMYTDSRDQIWVGTRNNGIYIVSGEKWQHLSQADGLPNDNVRAFAETKDGRMLIATFGGGLAIAELDGRNAESWGPPLDNNFIMGLLSESDGDIWAGTDGDGVYLIRNGSLRKMGVDEGLVYPRILSFLGNPDGTFWCASEGGGIFFFDGVRFHELTTAQGLPDNNVFTTIPDNTGDLWLTGNRGLIRLNEDRARSVALGRGQELPYKRLGKAEGMRSVECNFGGTQSGLLAQDGSVWFPTSNGIVVATPSNPIKNVRVPTPFIVSVVADQQTINEGDTLSSGADRLEITYTAPTFNRVDELAFEYRLEGYDNQWIQAGEERKAHYTRIPPGDYEFRVRSHRPGSDYRVSNPVHFTIKPKFHQTIWFYSLIGLAIAFLGFHSVRLRDAQVRLRETELKVMVQERTQELESMNQVLLETQNQLIDAAHTAGMAEVATQVLHNVGNAMNSINVSGQVLQQHTDQLQGDYLSKLVALLNENENHLADFFKSEKGQKILTSLTAYSKALNRTKRSLTGELLELRQRVDHVNDIIHAQQATATGGRLYERVSVSELITQAVKILEANLIDEDVNIIRTEADAPLVQLEKGKFLQVLVNVIKNACESYQRSGALNPRIHISLGTASRNRETQLVVITIRDYGPGIDTQALEQIFAHGFTTKPEGYGFGLHFCANAMADLKGDISVFSAGPHKGAEFTLILPATY